MSRIPTKSGIPKPSSGRSMIPKPGSARPGSCPCPGKKEEKKQLARVVPSQDELPAPPSRLQKKVFKEALVKTVQEPGQKVRRVGAATTRVAVPSVRTKRGEERVVQQMTVETTIQRTPKAEYIGKTMRGIDVDSRGVARQLELTAQQIDPTHATESAGVNETIETTSSLSITAGGKQTKKTFKKKSIMSKKLAKAPNLNPHHVNRLVKEENEDVENTLKMVPPELVSASDEKYPLKKKLQTLRLNAEPVSILTQSMIHPEPTADEVDAEAPPEVLASVMDAVEKGATPESAPVQIFNSLFPEVHEPRIGISSVAPGPLEDLVVPTDRPYQLIEEMLTQEMEEFLVKEVQNKQELPKDDICAENNITAVEPSSKQSEFRNPLILEGELPPWEEPAIQKISTIVGGEPLNLLEASDYEALETSGNLSTELTKGIDYFVDADVIPYDTKIQLRGSKIPKWFPGYMSALPHLPELVKISKSPSEVLHAAWKAVQPKAFPDDSILIV